ncbi:MAG: exostosin family protein [Candidatus Paceibacterota bacterium]|jgi:glycosyltransferase involved in cell wall biosynthesis
MTSTNHLTFYVNPEWRRKGLHTPFLNPWWGNPYEEAAIFSKQMFDTYSFDTLCYTITDNIEKADLVFAPYKHNWLLNFDNDLLAECISVARTHNLPLLIDGSGDIEHSQVGDNVHILRYGGYRFLPESNRIQIPLTTDDLLERCRNGQLSIRKKNESKPVVGFAGWTEISLKQYLRTIVKESPVRVRGLFDSRYRACTKGILWRQKAIKILSRSPQVKFNYLARSSFSANPKTAEGDMRKLQTEMVDTILESDYALDVRGDANNSARLFEILSLGRIPVIVDTERNFPFSERIDYSSFALIVNFRDINNLSKIISDFHKNISPERFEQMQKNARDVFVNYFRIDAFMKYVIEDLLKRIK